MTKLRVMAGGGALADKAYESIKNMILEQEIIPGQPLYELTLAERLGISRTPVRSAIARLEREALVTRIPNSGVIVSPIELKEVHDVFELRQFLEVRSLEKGFSRPEREQLQEFSERFREMLSDPELSMMEALRADEEFHMFIAHAGGNRWIVETLERVLQRSLMMRAVSTSHVGRPQETFGEHVALIELWQKGDREAAIASLKTHILRAKIAVLQMGDESWEPIGSAITDGPSGNAEFVSPSQQNRVETTTKD